MARPVGAIHQTPRTHVALPTGFTTILMQTSLDMVLIQISLDIVESAVMNIEVVCVQERHLVYLQTLAIVTRSLERSSKG